MVRSLNPNHNDFRTEPGRAYDNATIGERMLAALAGSIAEHNDSNNTARTRPAQAALELLAAARRRARRDGTTVTAVLREHMDALNEDSEGRGRFLCRVRDDSVRRVEGNERVQAEMERQDDRRAGHLFTELTVRAATLVDAIEASRTLVPHQTALVGADGVATQRPELASGAAASSGVLAMPAPRHPMGGQTPNALALHMPEQPALPALTQGAQEQAGGQDNPIELGDGSSSESSRAETMLTLLRNVQRRYAQARGQRD